MHAMCHAHLILLDFIILIIFVVMYKSVFLILHLFPLSFYFHHFQPKYLP